jgi:two-component system, cell cycle sensor histidine kinase and response regulator CckA
MLRPPPEAARATILSPSSLSAVISIDEHGVVVVWSPEAELLFGWTAEEMLGRRLSDAIIPERFREAHEAALRRFRETGEALVTGRVFEAEALRAAGGEFPVELSVSAPATAVDGRRVFTAFVRDLTERRRLEQLHRMQFLVTRAFSEASGLDAAAPAVLEAICTSIGWETAALWVVDRDDNKLHALTVWSHPDRDLDEFAAATLALAFGADEGLPGQVWSSGVPLSIPDFTTESRMPRRAAVERAGLHGAAGFPIVGAQSVIGVIELFSAAVQPPDPLLLSAMADVGSQLGQFVEHRLAEQLLRRRVHESEVLQRAAHALSASLDLDVVLDAVARSAAEALGAPRATVLRLDGKDLVIAGEYDEAGATARGRSWPVADLPGADAVRWKLSVRRCSASSTAPG